MIFRGVQPGQLADHFLGFFLQLFLLTGQAPFEGTDVGQCFTTDEHERAVDRVDVAVPTLVHPGRPVLRKSRVRTAPTPDAREVRQRLGHSIPGHATPHHLGDTFRAQAAELELGVKRPADGHAQLR